jgi:hypothetical protein
MFSQADAYKLFLVILSLSIVILSGSEESLTTDNEILRYRSE